MLGQLASSLVSISVRRVSQKHKAQSFYHNLALYFVIHPSLIRSIHDFGSHGVFHAPFNQRPLVTEVLGEDQGAAALWLNREVFGLSEEGGRAAKLFRDIVQIQLDGDAGHVPFYKWKTLSRYWVTEHLVDKCFVDINVGCFGHPPGQWLQ